MISNSAFLHDEGVFNKWPSFAQWLQQPKVKGNIDPLRPGLGDPAMSTIHALQLLRHQLWLKLEKQLPYKIKERERGKEKEKEKEKSGRKRKVLKNIINNPI